MANEPSDTIKRDLLPIPDSVSVGLTTYDAKDPNTKYPPIAALRPPAGAPNVLIVLIDDAGFGSSSAFGGPCHTPNAERLAKGGLKYIRFHTTALCSPTRQALLTGRNHHSMGMGAITEMATSAPGNCSIRPKSKAALAEILKLNGYSTAQFGKCREVPYWEVSPMGYSADEACDVGGDTGSPASPDYGSRGNTFTGEIHWVQIDIGTDDLDHLISPEERFRVAMARQ